MRKQFFLFMMACLFAMSAWAADVALKENFRVAPTGNTAAVSNKDWQGDLCTWHSTSVARRAADTINTATIKQATWLVLNSRVGEKIYTTNWEGGVKKLSFKFARYGKENTNGRVLKIKASVGTTEYESDGYAKSTLPSANVAAIVSPATTTGHVVYSYDFQHKANDQLTIENASTCSDAEAATNGICRILVSDIEITPYLLYRNKDVTIGLKQRGYVNNGSQDFINNTGSEGSIAFSSSNENVATVAPETGVVTPVGVGDAVITATWSEGASTTYTLHVVDGIIAENFSKVVQTGQTAGATWHGDLLDWSVANVRRGVDDTLGLSPRIQATAMRSNAGSTIISANSIEGGVKYLAFDWRQWASGTSPLTFKAYYSADKENWGDAVATQEVEAATASTPHVFGEDIDNGAKGNAYLKLEYTSGAGVAVIGALKITPYLLYTTKEATLDTRDNLTYTNTGLINNTTGDAPTYEIAPENAAVSINGDGQVAVENGADVNGDFIVTATWGAVTTTYTLHILSRSTANVSFAQEAVRIGLDGSVDNALNKDGHDGTAEYSSDNDAVATVDAASGAVTLQGGVGQVKISVSIPQTTNYKAASASYNLYVRDNGARKEAFKGLNQSGVVGVDLKDLVDATEFLFDWQAQYQVRRGANDTIWNTTTKGVSIGISTSPSAPSILQSKNPVEGGIKHLSFYWKQWAKNSDKTLRMSAYAGSTLMAADEHASNSSETYSDYEKFLFGASAKMKSNQQLIIKNESYTGSDFEHGTLAADAARIIIDTIYITPYLLYTTKERTLDMKTESSCTYTPEIDNTGSGNITYSLEDNDDEASINATTGEVTGIKAGEVTVKAEWSEGAYTTYTLTILAKSVTEASYPNAIVRIGLDEAVDNTLAYTAGYDGTIEYASSNTAVASVASNGAITINGVGQTTITATLLETENYFAAEASYNLYVRDNGARIENFSNVETGHGVIGVKDTVWMGTYFDWIPTGAIRHNNSDTIWGEDAANRKVWIATSALSADPAVEAGVLASKEEIEGGIKYLSFYWKQWGSESGRTLRIATFDGEERKGYMEYVPNGASTQEKFLLGVNDMMRNNHRLYIKNESFKTETFDGTIADDGTASKSRIIIDDIYITPYLLFTDKAERVLRIGDTDKNESLINNTGDAAEFSSSDPNVASVASDGTVTAKARGKVIITAKYQWSEEEVVTTTYPVAVYPVNCETFSNEATASSYAANEESAAGDKATWTARLAGINVGDFEPNVAFIRAPRQGEDKEAYLYSSPIAGGIGSMTFDWNLVAGEANTNWDIRILINGREVKRLGNSDLATDKMENFAQITIEDINEPGNFVIRFENHSTINGKYESGNKARFVIDNITWTSYEGTKVLAENTDNEGWIRANGGQTRDVIISRSPLVANVWNTLCLPFAISKADDLDGAEVKEMTSVAMEGEVLNIYFSDIEGDELQAGKPYLVKPDDNKNISGTYNDKQISSIASPVKNGDVTMQGMFSPVAVTKDDYNTLFVGTPDAEGNNLFYPQADGTLRGLRAYFKIGGAPLSAPRRARYVVTQKDVVTGIESVQNSDVRIQKIIRDGQLFIIRDGKMYNAQGQVIK